MSMLIKSSFLVGGVAAYTSYNQPMAPGNENFPNQAPGFQLELEKNLPTVNVKYRFPWSKQDMSNLMAQAESDAAFDAALSDAYLQFKADAADLGSLAGSRKYSFIKSRDPFTDASSGVGIGDISSANQYTDLSELFQGMRFSARPVGPNASPKIDPASFETVSSCDRDYQSGCPAGFASEGGACVATSAYRGPCGGEAIDFSSMSESAKVRWQSQCQAYFPCKSCTRDYSVACPEGFTSSDGKCVPGASYTGVCGTTDFTEFNAAMLKSWADNCGASWPCA